MSWLKRNLILVIGGVAAVVLLAASGYFLFAGIGKNTTVSEELERQANDFTRLNTRNPSATQENIDAAKTEQERMAGIVGQFREHFAPYGYFTNVSSEQFKFALATSLNQLEMLAESQGVKRPKDFAYTFDKQRSMMVFNPVELVPWTYQLLEIRALCQVIYRAKVHSLLSIQRATVSSNDVATAVLKGVAPKTNSAANAVTTPYEIVFQGFTTELAAVLEGFAKSSNAFLIKNINVERSTRNLTTSRTSAAGSEYATGRYAPSAAAGNAVMSRYGIDPRANAAARRESESAAIARRYGTGGRGVPGAGAAPAYNPYAYSAVSRTARRGPETILDEHLLKFTLRLDAVRPLMAAR